SVAGSTRARAEARLLLRPAASRASPIDTFSRVAQTTLGGAPPVAPATAGSQGRPPAGSGGFKPAGTGGNPGSTQFGQTASPSTSAGGSVVGVLVHSPGEALMMAGMWLLFIAAGVSVVRRRTLLDALRRKSA